MKLRQRRRCCLRAALGRALTLLHLLADFGHCDYRSIPIRNADVCHRKKLGLIPMNSKKVLKIGEGAILFNLKSPPLVLQSSIRNRREMCEIQIEAPERHGIVAHVEQMHMRRNSKDGKCLDFVQFGRDDVIPFITLKKSERLCGERNSAAATAADYSFNDPGGNLLVWIHLGGRRKTSNWPYIGVVNLTLVVTSYRRNCGGRNDSRFRLCGGGSDVCVRKDYFCDRHFNCPPAAAAGRRNVAPDERGCEVVVDDDVELDDDDVRSWGGDLNIVTWTLILVCTCFLLVVLFLAVVVRVRRSGRRRRRSDRRMCCCGCDGESSDFEVERPGGGGGLIELSSQRGARRGERGTESERQNVYVPLWLLDGQRRDRTPPRPTSIRSRPPPLPPPDDDEEEEMPPPAYAELFPQGAPQDVMATITDEPSSLSSPAPLLLSTTSLAEDDDPARRREDESGSSSPAAAAASSQAEPIRAE